MSIHLNELDCAALVITSHALFKIRHLCEKIESGHAFTPTSDSFAQIKQLADSVCEIPRMIAEGDAREFAEKIKQDVVKALNSIH